MIILLFSLITGFLYNSDFAEEKLLKKNRWQFVFGLSLMGLSALFYILHFFIFRDPHHIFIYLVSDIAFVFVEVLMVTLIIHQLLSKREKKERIEKLNLVIGSFFSELGTQLLFQFSRNDPGIDTVKNELLVNKEWDKTRYAAAKKSLEKHVFHVEIQEDFLENLLLCLAEKRDFLLRILENPTLHEHESFTDLIYAVFHLFEELNVRKQEGRFREDDKDHITGDIKRAYSLMVLQWLNYACYLQHNYPFLFSFTSFNNPFTKIV